MCTALVYRHLNLVALAQREIPKIISSYRQGHPIHFNDLQNSACSINPLLQKIYNDLVGVGFSEVVMTGSGSCFFCLGLPDLSQYTDVTLIPIHGVSRKKCAWYRKNS
jgi:4-diphosphocytidyl-2-C-methyl-D-erythritol kinase